MDQVGRDPLFDSLLDADEVAIDAFLDDALPEGATLDYKGAVPHDISETIAAFANSDGGTIVMGVEEDKRTKKPAGRPGINHRDPLGTISNVVRAYLDPIPAYRPHVIARTAGHPYVVVVVPPSTRRIVLHRQHGILVRLGDQSVALNRLELDRLVARERAVGDERSEAIAASAGLLGVWGGGDGSGPLFITAAIVPTPGVVVPFDRTLDAAIEAAATELIYGSWQLVRNPDETTLIREDPADQSSREFVEVKQGGQTTIRFASEKYGSTLDPNWLINASDLAADIVSVVLIPIRAAEIDDRLRPETWAVSVTITGYARRRIFFALKAMHSLAASERVSVRRIARSALVRRPADAVMLAQRIVADLARVHDTDGFESWSVGLGDKLADHSPRLERYKGQLSV